jgi:hypothetical protein
MAYIKIICFGFEKYLENREYKKIYVAIDAMFRGWKRD